MQDMTNSCVEKGVWPGCLCLNPCLCSWQTCAFNGSFSVCCIGLHSSPRAFFYTEKYKPCCCKHCTCCFYRCLTWADRHPEAQAELDREALELHKQLEEEELHKPPLRSNDSSGKVLPTEAEEPMQREDDEEEGAARQKALEEEAARQKALEEEAAKQKALEEEEARQKALEEEAAKQKALEETAKQKALEEEAAKQKALEEEEARQKALEEEEARHKALEEETDKVIEAEEDKVREQAAAEEERVRSKAIRMASKKASKRSLEEGGSVKTPKTPEMRALKKSQKSQRAAEQAAKAVAKPRQSHIADHMIKDHESNPLIDNPYVDMDEFSSSSSSESDDDL